MQGLLGGSLRAGQLLAAGPSGARAALLAALRGLAGSSSTTAPTAAGAAIAAWAALERRAFAQDAGQCQEKHPHHHYADTHRPYDDSTQRGPQQQGQQAAKQPHTPAAISRYGRRPEGPPAHALLELGQRHGVQDSTEFYSAVVKLTIERQHGLLEHTYGVVQHLQSLGLGLETVGRMLQRCPALFSFPSEERAEVLLGELMGQRCGRTAVQAAELFIACPALANTRHVMPSIVRLVCDNHTD